MCKHILVAIDGSIHSQQALPTAIDMAKKFDSEILVLHVSEHDRGRAAVFSLETPAEATIMVGDAVNAARQAGVKVRGQLRDVAAGHVAKAIVEAAEANGMDLIVMGSRGLSDVQGLMLGSVTHKVVQTSDIPVLITRPATKKGLANNGAMVSLTA
jgi:nucleotide-binding universal stress UspA family protein